jgi:hypothetical protein
MTTARVPYKPQRSQARDTQKSERAAQSPLVWLAHSILALQQQRSQATALSLLG